MKLTYLENQVIFDLTTLCKYLIFYDLTDFSLEMEEERVYNEMSSFHNIAGGSATGTLAAAAHANSVHRTRTVSSPVPVNVSLFH